MSRLLVGDREAHQRLKVRCPTAMAIPLASLHRVSNVYGSTPLPVV